MRLQFQYAGNLISLDAEPDGEAWRVRLPNGTEHRIIIQRRADDTMLIQELFTDQTAQRFFLIPFARRDKKVSFSFEGSAYSFTAPSPSPRKGRSKSDSGLLSAPMTGIVADVLVTEGEIVEPYQPLAVLEAMKVMTSLDSPFSATIFKVHVRKGQQVSHGDPIIEVKPIVESAHEETK